MRRGRPVAVVAHTRGGAVVARMCDAAGVNEPPQSGGAATSSAASSSAASSSAASSSAASSSAASSSAAASSDGPPPPRVFSPAQVAVATLFGTPVAGAWLAATNLAVLGGARDGAGQEGVVHDARGRGVDAPRGRRAGRLLFVAVFALVAALDLVLALLDAPDWATFAFVPIDVGVAYALARRFFAAAARTHRRRSTREVAQRVIGAAVLYTAVVVGGWLAIVSFGPASWKAALQDAAYVGADEAVRFDGDATRADAEAVARVLVDAGALTGSSSVDATVSRFGPDASLTILVADENARFRIDRALPHVAAALSTCVHLQERTKEGRVRRTAKACAGS